MKRRLLTFLGLGLIVVSAGAFAEDALDFLESDAPGRPRVRHPRQRNPPSRR